MLRTILSMSFTIALAAAPAMADDPALVRVMPGAVRPGTTTALTVHGDHLTGATGLWTSFPAHVTRAPDDLQQGNPEKQLTYLVDVPAEVPPGVAAVRIGNLDGISNLGLMLVDDLASVAEASDNHQRGTAQSISPPVAVDGWCDAEQSDWFRLEARAGERLSLEVMAGRIGSLLDPVVRVLDAAGNEVTYSDDEPGLGCDSRLVVDFPADGDYFIELRDVRFQGGETHGYRLRLGDFPIVTAVYPLGAKRGSTCELALVGLSPDPLEVRLVEVPPCSPGDLLLLSAHTSAEGGAAFVSLLASDLPNILEPGAHVEPGAATALSLPCAINGRLAAAGELDTYEFEARQTERWIFSGRTRSLGAATDLYVRIVNAAGDQIAEADDSGTGEGTIDFRVPQDGRYRLLVEDLLRRGGPTMVYRIEVERYQPGFELFVEVENVDAPSGGAFVLPVKCARRDYGGPIELTVVGAGEGVQLEGQTIAEGTDETSLRVTLPPAMEAGTLLSIGIDGRATIEGEPVSVRASTMPALRNRWPQMPYPPPMLDGQLGLAVRPEFPPFFDIAVAEGAAYLPRLVGAASFPIEVKRLHGEFSDPLNITVEGLPEGVTAEVKPVDDGKAQYTVSLSGPPEIAAAEHQLRVVALGSFQNQRQTVTLDAVPLSVGPPLRVTIEAAGPIMAGGKQQATLRAQRFGEPSPVTITWREGPVGIAAPIRIVLPADQNEATIELTAAADAPVGPDHKLQVAATTQVGEQEVEVVSPAAVLAIEQPPGE
ncbi:MAG: PPC domain-containing protein [Pirellulales bacterium]